MPTLNTIEAGKRNLAYQNYQNARKLLDEALQAEGAAKAKEYYKSEARPLDDAARERAHNVAAKISLVANPRGKQKSYTLDELKSLMLGWSAELWKI